MNERLRKFSLAETYNDLRLMIYKIAHSYSRKYHVAYDEVLSQSHLIFVKAYDRYNPDKAEITTWVSFCLHKGLTTYLIKEYRHRNYCEINEEILSSHTENADTFMVELEDELDFNSNRVIHHILHDEELHRQLSWLDVKTPNRFLSVTKKHLETEGWDPEVIDQAYDDIRWTLMFDMGNGNSKRRKHNDGNEVTQVSA